MKKGTGIQNY